MANTAGVSSVSEEMIREAVDKLIGVSGKMSPPQMSGSYNYVSTVASKLDAFLASTDLSADCDGRIDYVIAPNPSNSEASSSSRSPKLVLSYLNASRLTELIDGNLAVPKNSALPQTVFVLPSMTALSLPAVPLIPSPPITPQSYNISAQFTSTYLATVEGYVTSLSDGTIPQDMLDSLKINSERLEYDLELALNQTLAQTGSRGFRKPNSTTTTAMRGVYAKYLDVVQTLCAEFVGTVFDLLVGAKSLGISSERVQIDFTTGLNDLALAITAFQIKRYEDAISDSVAKYNLAVAKVNAQLLDGQYRIKRSMFDVQELLLSLSTTSTASELSAAHIRNLLTFAEVYKDGNQAWLKEKQQQTQVELFNIQSEQSETLLDLEAETRGFTLSNTILKTNHDVLRDKLNILKTDLDAYAALGDAIPIDLKEAVADFELLHKEFNLKLLAAGQIPKILEGAGNVVTAMLKADITVNSKKGTT